MAESESINLLAKGTVDSLFDEIDKLPMLEKRNYIDDWIIHFASTNPVYEPADDEEFIDTYLFVKDNLVTNFSNVYVAGDSFGWNLEHELTKIKNTNWFYIKFTREKGTRLNYLITPLEPGTRIEGLKRIEENLLKLDNRNKDTAQDERIYSVAQFPGFIPFPKQSSEEIKYSTLRLARKLQGSRTAKISTIRRSEKEIPKKLILIHDGEISIEQMKIDLILKQGIDDNRWPSLALVCLSVKPEDRIQEYGNDGHQYSSFFRDYILTAVEDYLDKSFKPDDIVVAGSSLGGWAAFDVVWNNPDRIKNVICQSSPWWWSETNPNYYLNEVVDSKKKKLGRIYIDSGMYETLNLNTNTYDCNKDMVRNLLAKKYKVMGKEYLMGHRYQSWAWAFPSALDYVINGQEEYQPPTGRVMGAES
ncbi:MAG: alpha/beta hydrolase [Candidatus Kariarchaeaceae archaeon]